MKISRFWKRVLCLTLAVLLTYSMSIVGASATEQDGIITGTVNLYLYDGTPIPEQTYYYSDDYFRTSGKLSNEHLRTMSAFAAFNIDTAIETNAQDRKKLLSDIGFDRFKEDDLEFTSADSIGTLLASKIIDGVPVIAVEIRAAGYNREWVSNFQAGRSGDISGFEASAQKVTERIRSYMYAAGMEKAKFWVSGYSRAGSVANLVGKELNENLDLYKTTADDIYVYTFEAARCTANPVAYENIHNIVDSNDVFPLVYPGVWQMGRHGIDEEIGDLNAAIMTKTFIAIEPYSTDFIETNQAEFLRGFTDFIGNTLSRDTYVELLQEPLGTLSDIYFGTPRKERTVLLDYLKAVGTNIQKDENLMSVFLSVLVDAVSETTIEKVTDLLINNLNKTADEIGKPVSDEDYESVISAIEPIVRALMPIVKEDLYRVIETDGGTVNAPLYYLLSFAGNASTIITNHFNSTVLEKLKARDSYYTERAEELFGDTDNDGMVDAVDAAWVQRYDTELCQLDEAACIRADVDLDGMVTIIDATWILRYVVDLSTLDNIGQPV